MNKTDKSQQEQSKEQKQQQQQQQQKLPTHSQAQTQMTIPHKFTYEFFQQNRYTISQSAQYECLCNNGFIKFYSPKARVYWHTQNEFSHQTPDWKFHVSVSPQHLKKAWNLIVSILIQTQANTGMKVVYLNQSKPVTGREITIYILKYDPIYHHSKFAKDFGLSLAAEHSRQFYVDLVVKVEKILQLNQIKPNGCANGDLPIGRYISLRNEAFVRNNRDESVYPSDQEGWNPRGMELPIDAARLIRKLKEQPEQQQNWKVMDMIVNVKNLAYIGAIASSAFFLGKLIYHR